MIQKNIFEPTVAQRGINLALLLISTVGGILSCLSAYFSGMPTEHIYFQMFQWTVDFSLAILVSNVCILIQSRRKNKYLLALPFLVLLMPISFTILSSTSNHIPWVFMVLHGFVILFICTVLSRVLSKLIQGISQIKSQFKSDDSSPSSQSRLSNDVLNKVITSVLNRASSSGRSVIFALLVMMVVVIVGAAASFGTVALNEAQKIRELESERVTILQLVKAMQIDDGSELAARNKRLEEIITSRYREVGSYNNILVDIEKQTNVSWPDIAMRIAIAALTLFLVQIFFHVYKYNQQQASLLHTKAEILELYKQEGANQHELRNILLSKIDGNPRFERSPASPTDQIINVFNKSKEGGI